MSDLALSVLRNQSIVVNLEWLNLQALGSLGLPRNKRTVVRYLHVYLNYRHAG
jgi:hypothetical protein